MSENEMNEIQKALMELTVNIKHMDSKQDEMINDVKSIKEAIYNPETAPLLTNPRDHSPFPPSLLTSLALVAGRHA